jgi:hypothetical protein
MYRLYLIILFVADQKELPIIIGAFAKDRPSEQVFFVNGQLFSLAVPSYINMNPASNFQIHLK